jgi:hypothetical protein
MKKFLLFLFACLIMGGTSLRSQTATVTATNFDITNAGTKFTFDIYVLRTSADPYNMGLSTFVMQFTDGVMNNPVISNQSPRYSTGNYGPMATALFFGQQVALQINYISGPGVEVLADGGANGLGERVATITLDILQNVQAQVTWEASSSEIVTPTFTPIITGTYNGNYNGTLPVELSSFTSAVSNNNVILNWTTTGERNNSGFDIERKALSSNDWQKVNFVEGHGNSTQTVEYSYQDNNLNIGSYQYRLKQIDFNGNFEYFNLQSEIVIGAPQVFELKQNYPNPFNPSTKISFSLPSDSKVTLEIYDMSGKMVARILNNEFRSANYYTVDFNASDLSSGMYFYSLKTNNSIDTKKMLLVK